MPGWPTHLLQMALVSVVIAAPVPLALATVRGLSLRDQGATVHLLAALTFATAMQVAVGILLGLAGLLTAPALLVAEATLLVVGAFFLRRSGMPRLWPERPFDGIEAGALLVVLLAGGLGLADLVVRPTQNFDSLAYHLPVMARWVSSARLELFRELGQVAFYPGHWELLSTMLQLPLGQDLLVSAPNLLAWAQLGLAIAFVARVLGGARSGAIVCAALVLLTPSVLSRLDAIQPDIALAALFVTALGFALRRNDDTDHLGPAVILVSIGLLAGLKLSGPAYAMMVVGAMVAAPGFTPSRVRWSRASVAAAGCAMLLLGAFWYARNWIALGNPFGDLEIRMLGFELFAGSITGGELQRGSLANVFDVTRVGDWSVLGSVLWEWLGAGAVMMLGMAAVSLRRRERRRLTVAVLMVLCGVLYWRTPYGGDNGTHGWHVTPWIEVGLRYGFAALALLGVLAGSSLRGRWTWAALALLVATSVLTVLEHLVPHVVVLVLIVGFAWVVAVMATGRRVRRAMRIAVGAASILLVVIGLGLARADREVRRARDFGRIVDVLATELGPDDVVAVVHSQKLHLAAGHDWKRRVELPKVPAAGAERSWAAGLRRDGVTALLLGHKEPPPQEVGDVRRVQRFIRDGGDFELVSDYESLSKDLALFRLRPQSKR